MLLSCVASASACAAEVAGVVVESSVQLPRVCRCLCRLLHCECYIHSTLVACTQAGDKCFHNSSSPKGATACGQLAKEAAPSLPLLPVFWP